MTPAILLAVLLAVVAVVTLGLLAGPASAQPTFTTCASCHSMSAVHGNANHSSFFGTCSTCHNNGGTSNPPLPSACASCHGGTTAILAKPTHTTNACGTTVGCHGYTSPTPTPTPTVTVATTTLTAKAAPTIVKLGKKVKVSGLAGPVPALVGAKIALKVERKVGTKWLKMKTGTATASATGAYAWSYKAVKKGSHRVTVSIAKTAKFTAKKVVKTFKVK
jgi:hypothetical protein